MSHWINPTINLGVIKAGYSKKVTFKALDTIPRIKQITPYCGCTTTSYKPNRRELIINYSNAAIPPQVIGVQAITKRIDITYEDDTMEVLIIKATKIR
jgi:hypothetical protein